MVEAKPLITVIVPFYNIEGCVHYCMESLLNQTFTNYEIVCVDDGSTDNTFKLLDEYKQAEFVRVFHINNCGVGEARNFGVKQAKGRYITFVDGDDFVSPYYLEGLLNAYESIGGNGFVLAGHVKLRQTDVKSFAGWEEPNFKAASRRDVMLDLLYERMITSPWARLADKSLYEKHPFPNMKYEDVAIAAEHVTACDTYAVLDKPIYGYVIRDSSTTHIHSVELAQVLDYIDAVNKQLDDVSAMALDLKDACIYKRALEESRVYRLLGRTQTNDRVVQQLKATLIGSINNSMQTLLRDGCIPFLNKVRFIILTKMPWMYSTAMNFFEASKYGK